MTVYQASYPSDAELQLAVYNQNLGGAVKRSMTFANIPSGISWAVVGIVVADVATPADLENTLIPAITALPEVTSVNGDQVWGQIPATIEATNHECVLYVVSTCTAGIGTAGDYFTDTSKRVEQLKPPVGKKWAVLVLRVPAALDETKIAALESAIEGITGITTCEHLIDGTTSARQVGGATLRIDCHMRIEPTEV